MARRPAPRSPDEPKVRALPSADDPRWGEFYRAYATFDDVPETEAMATTVRSWLSDPHGTLECTIAMDEGGTPAGLAHRRPFARPLTAANGCC